MVFLSVFFIGVALSMDAFAVSVTNGIKQRESQLKQAFITALTFGIFQGIMPFIGWAVGIQFHKIIESVDHWVVFAILSFVGGKMIYEAFKNDEENSFSSFNIKILLISAFATSVDALTVGVGFAFDEINTLQLIIPSCLLIAVTTTLITFAGFYIGRKFGSKYKKTAEISGGIILIIIAVKTLIEHLFT